MKIPSVGEDVEKLEINTAGGDVHWYITLENWLLVS